jgi:hypothetical protein
MKEFFELPKLGELRLEKNAKRSSKGEECAKMSSGNSNNL